MPLSGYGVPDTAPTNKRRRTCTYRYNTDKAQNAYGRFLSQQRGERRLSDVSRTFNQSDPSYKSKFGQRGLTGGGIRSGAAKRSMGNYLGDYARDYGRAQQDITQDLQQYDL